MNTYMRFSLDRRGLFGPVPFDDFRSKVRYLAWLMESLRPNAVAEILTCEDEYTYNYSTVSFSDESVTQALLARKRYKPDDLTADVWARSFNVEMHITEPRSSDSFMLTVSCDRHADGRRILFYGHQLGEEVREKVQENFAYRNLGYRLGNGRSKDSEFNFNFAQKMRLRIPLPN